MPRQPAHYHPAPLCAAATDECEGHVVMVPESAHSAFCGDLAERRREGLGELSEPFREADPELHFSSP